MVDLVEPFDHPLTDGHGLDLAQFEVGGFNQMLLFRGRQALPEEPGLAKLVLETLTAGADLVPVDLLGIVDIAPHLLGGHHGAAASQRIGEVADPPFVDGLAHVAITLVVVDLDHRPVDGDLGKIRATQADQLRIQVGEEATLQERVIGEVDTRHHMAGMERNLFGLGKEVVGVAVEHHLADALHRHQFSMLLAVRCHFHWYG